MHVGLLWKKQMVGKEADLHSHCADDLPYYAHDCRPLQGPALSYGLQG